MLYIFDKDQTLVGGPNGRPANHPEEQKVLPGVAEKIAALRADGHEVAIASNQGGIAWGFITEGEVFDLMQDCARKIGYPRAKFCFSPYDPRAKGKPGSDPLFAKDDDWRKPRPGMIIHLMQELGYRPKDTIFVGDMESDQQAANNAGVKFEWAKDFFNA